MKTIWLADLVLLLFLSSGCNRQPATPPAANAAATNKATPSAGKVMATPGPGELSTKGTNYPALDEITTRNGTKYRNVTVQRIDPDGLTIGYVPVDGGLGAAKLKYEDLPDDLRQRYAYSTNKAAAYTAQQAQGMAEWRAQQQSTNP